MSKYRRDSIPNAKTPPGTAREDVVKPSEDAVEGYERAGKGREDAVKSYEVIGKRSEDVGKGYEDAVKSYEVAGKGWEDTVKGYEDVGKGWEVLFTLSRVLAGTSPVVVATLREFPARSRAVGAK